MEETLHLRAYKIGSLIIRIGFGGKIYSILVSRLQGPGDLADSRVIWGGALCLEFCFGIRYSIGA